MVNRRCKTAIAVSEHHAEPIAVKCSVQLEHQIDVVVAVEVARRDRNRRAEQRAERADLERAVAVADQDLQLVATDARVELENCEVELSVAVEIRRKHG